MLLYLYTHQLTKSLRANAICIAPIFVWSWAHTDSTAQPITQQLLSAVVLHYLSVASAIGAIPVALFRSEINLISPMVDKFVFFFHVQFSTDSDFDIPRHTNTHTYHIHTRSNRCLSTLTVLYSMTVLGPCIAYLLAHLAAAMQNTNKWPGAAKQ